ncbi:hypothetical protein FSARC_3015 [Fusarium sarcochroum]|uniref:GPI inositol-deacylase winged helix domain-containing protein n=1 Tax=Fusarium sarcochroum TaxID=1208366 RepID=A0A8H4XCD1_9HYPO|nr:hypothetical protein FSARC_3015 [Fusarium sarcochroum]
MLCHIIAQLINSDETIMRLAYEKCSSVNQIEFSDLKNLAQDCLAAHRNAYLILDGLDEGINTEPEVSLQWCLEELLQALSSRGCHLKLLIFGQRDGRLDPILSHQPQIRLDTINSHQKDIEQYSKSQATEIRARFALTQEEEQDMLTKIASASQGMFLYAKVVLANLISMDSVEEFEDEMQSDKFPDNLEQAYDRVIQRVLKEASPSRQNTVKKILGWVICSKRPLRWREIQSRFCINADKGTCNAKGVRRDSCKKICGSLVDVTGCDLFGDVESEQIVNIVHETASKYLVHNGTINLLQEHADMALFCCRYLSSGPFLEISEAHSVPSTIQSGYFGFLDYAAVHYFSHAQKVESWEPSSEHIPNPGAQVVSAMVDLLDAHHVGASDQPRPTAWTERLFKDKENLNLAIQNRVSAVREETESLQESLSGNNTFLTLYGRTRFKCPKIHCTKFDAGLLEQSDRDKHLDFHQRPFRCTYTDCFAHTLGYASQERLQAHSKTLHPSDLNLKVTFPITTGNKKWDIFEACKRGNLAEVKRFHFSGNESTKTKLHSHLTPFLVAARAGRGHICKFFMDQGESPFDGKEYGYLDWSPMAEGIRQPNAQTIELFLHSGFDLEGDDGRLQLARYIALAILCDFQDGLEQLLETRTSLEHVEMIGDVMESLIDQSERSHLISGIKGAHTIDATLLKVWSRRAFPQLTHGGETESIGTSFIRQLDSPEFQAYKALLVVDACFLHRAFSANCRPLSAFLMDFVNKVDLQVTDELGRTPLQRLADSYCFSRDCESCSIVTKRIIEVDGGASANTADNTGQLPAHTAMHRGMEHSLAFRILLSHTKNLNHKGDNGQSLLHQAIRSIGNVRILLEYAGVDLFIRNSKGQSVFSDAVISSWRERRLQVIEALTEANRTLAWTEDDTEHRLTPLHHAFDGLDGLDGLDPDKKRFLDVARFLLLLPEVEHVLRAYSASSGENHPEKVREFARQENLQEALKVMDRIGF